MKYDESRLKKLVEDMEGQSLEFIINFFISCDNDIISAFENYLRDLESYSLTSKSIKKNYSRLYEAFFDITGMKVYCG